MVIVINMVLQRDFKYSDDFSLMVEVTVGDQSQAFSRLRIDDGGSYIEPCY